MKKLGIIGGMGPESTIEYYNRIVYGYQKINDQDYFPNIIIESVNMFEMLELCRSKQYDSLTLFLLKAIKNVYKGGAEFAVLSANTPHIVFDKLKEKSPIPLISIVEETCKKVKDDGVKTVGLIGTSFTMENDFFIQPFIENNMKVVIPEKKERDFINGKIISELEYGIIKEETKQDIINIIEQMVKDHGIEGIILGCTELPLLIKDGDIKERVYDTMDIHVKSILSHILE